MKQRGFVLAATLWVLAIFALVAGYFAAQVIDALDLAYGAARQAQARLAMEGVRAEALFRLAVTPMSEYGLGTVPKQAVALDGRAYQAAPGILIEFQDARGLLSLNALDETQLRRLLGVLGVPADRRSRLIDTLLDYIDNNNLRRLNGAEDQDYRAAGLPPPADEKLRTPAELRRVMGWSDEAVLWQDGRLLDLVDCSPISGINPNTARPEILATLPGVTPAAAHKVIEQRARNLVGGPGELAQLVQTSATSLGMRVINLPAESVRITQRAAEAGWQLRYNVTLTPFGDRAPWQVDYSYRLPLNTDPDPPSTDAKVASRPAILAGTDAETHAPSLAPIFAGPPAAAAPPAVRSPP